MVHVMRNSFYKDVRKVDDLLGSFSALFWMKSETVGRSTDDVLRLRLRR